MSSACMRVREARAESRPSRRLSRRGHRDKQSMFSVLTILVTWSHHRHDAYPRQALFERPKGPVRSLCMRLIAAWMKDQKICTRPFERTVWRIPYARSQRMS
jgi:hypothetical protein